MNYFIIIKYSIIVVISIVISYPIQLPFTYEYELLSQCSYSEENGCINSCLNTCRWLLDNNTSFERCIATHSLNYESSNDWETSQIGICKIGGIISKYIAVYGLCFFCSFTAIFGFISLMSTFWNCCKRLKYNEIEN